MRTSRRRHAAQRGSALLIVLVFAAIIAIMLYRELPVATFEAQRQKEQLLIDRGNEYERAIKLYVRKFQTFPPSIEALENTNRMRFLRNRYVDPFTGKTDWRLLHAGPGGVIVDSKIKQNAPGLNGAPGAPGSSAASSSPLGAPASVTNPFANSFDGANPNSTGQPGAGANFPQRPPAISANGGGVSPGSDPLAAPATAPDGQPAPSPALATAMQDLASQNPSQPGIDPSNPIPGNGPPPPVVGPGNTYRPGRYGDGGPTMPPPGSQAAMQSLLNTQNPPPTVQNGPPTTPTTSAFGQTSPSTNASGSPMGAMSGTTMGAGIAGVASISPGRTIKVVNDQSDRSLWEFVYDMQKEAMANAPTVGTQPNNNGSNNNTGNSNNGNNNSGFGSTNSPPSQSSALPTPPSQSSNQ